MDKKHRNSLSSPPQERGQSLVEMAVFLPIFIILIAGLVEVSNLVLTQNRISNAARVATRFAANGGEDAGIWVVALNAVTQTLPLTEDRWDIWSIRGTLSHDTNSNTIVWDDFSMNHIYGISSTERYTAFASSVVTIQENIRLEMIADSAGNPLPLPDVAGPEGLQIVGTILVYDVTSILGLDQFIGDFWSVEGLSVMRRPNTVSSVSTDGCTGAFPIALEEGVRSVTAANFPSTFEYPTSNPPQLRDFPAQPAFEVGLDDAREGIAYLFEDNGFADRDYGFLSWDNLTPLATSLEWPGNSELYFQPGDSSDTELHVGNTVFANNNVDAAVKAELNEHVDRRRALRVIVFDDADNGPPNQYKVWRFAVFRIHGYDFNNQWLLAEFVRWDDSCGQIVTPPAP